MYFEKLYAFTNSYVVMYELLCSTIENLFSPPITFANPIQVMLGPRLYSIDEVNERVNFPIFCDYKYDGLRLIIQNEYGRVKLFSRNLEDLTSQFREVVEFVQKNYSNTQFVVDGECLGFTTKMEQVPFQQLSRRIMVKSHNLKLSLIIGMRFFDILELEGELVYQSPLYKRQEMLRKLFLNNSLRIDKSFSKEDVVEKLQSYFRYN
jgi:DNA ligase-1